MWHAWERKNLHRVWFIYLKERDHLENQGVGRIILKWTFHISHALQNL